jgi:ABC-type transport system involved in multi-copper enzyme maturation permease subunit
MKLPPLVERELRAGARRPAFYWLRGLLALVLGFQAYDLLIRYAIAPRPRFAFMAAAPPPRTITGSILLQDMTALLFLAVLLMGLVTADSISRERREGTLGLLLLTHVSPAELVCGKLLSCGLNCFILLLGCLPALMFTVLAGGVGGGQAAMTGLGLLNTLFVSLAAGLWMSAVFRERRHAMAATLGLVAALAFGPEVLGASLFGSATVPLMRLFGLAGWVTAANADVVLAWKPMLALLTHFGVQARLLLFFNPVFLCWFVITQGIGWFLLYLAAAALAKNWQDEPHLQFRAPEPQDEWSLCGRRAPEAESAAEWSPTQAVPSRASWLTDPRPWDEDPIEWRVRQMRPPEGLIWLAVAFNFFAQFGALGSIFGSGGTFANAWGMLSFGGLAIVFFSGGLLAWAGARFFLDTRQQQDLELLLTSPIGSRNILAGQLRVLRQALKWPLAVVLLLAVPSAISLIWDLSSASGSEIWPVTPTFLIAVNLVLEVLALCWVGMCFGLRARNKFAAISQTIGLVQFLPLLIAIVLSAAWAVVSDHSLSAMTSHRRMPTIVPVLLFFLAKNVALILWAHFRLRRDLRLGRRVARLDKAARRFVLQPA